MKHKKVLIGGCISVVLLVLLTFVYLGKTKEKLDPVLWEHVKSIVDFYPDTGKIIKVYQMELSTSWLYLIKPNEGDFWMMIPETIFPTRIIQYKDKFILFYLAKEEKLSKKKIYQKLNINSDTDLGIYEKEDSREWIYVKDKESDKSFFTQKVLHEKYDDYLPFGW